MASVAPTFELPNVGPGPDPCSLAALAADNEFVIVLFQRSPLCTNCKKQVQTFADWHDEFRERGAELVSILPGDREDAADWQEQFDLPYPLLVDSDARTGDAFGQPVRFGIVGQFSDFLGRLPKAVILDCRRGEPEVVWSHEGTSRFDRPGLEEMLGELDRLREQ